MVVMSLQEIKDDERMEQHRYNIVTSSDNTLIPQITISLTAMAKNLQNKVIDFYFLHSQVTPDNINLLATLCKGYGNILFHEIKIPDPEAYDFFVQAGRWYRETYYSLCAHLLLPDTVDRALYLDAGDTLVVGDIGPYYTDDFEDNFLIVTGHKYKMENGVPELFSSEDFTDRNNYFSGILEGVFNSGSYMMNLKKMREDDLTLSDFHAFTDWLRKKERISEEEVIYFGDQGLLSAAFIGKLKYYGYPQIYDVFYNPYNFCIGCYDYIDKKPGYQPAILHFAGVPFKPWKARYPVFPERFRRSSDDLRELTELKPLQVEYYFQWLDYLFLTDKVLRLLGY